MKLAFFGDISLYNIDSENFRFCPNLKQLLAESDMNIGNLECPITLNLEKDTSLAVTMYADQNALYILEKFNCFSLANNHVRDFKDKGITDTLEVLQNRGFKYFGVGKSPKEALAPLIIEKGNFMLAFIGATRFANANGSNLGTGNDNSQIIIKQIKQLKLQGYFICILPHWGYEYVRIPSPRERRLAHRWIDAGADIIIGSHPHIYQTIEIYKGKTIVYSLGNFIFHSSVFEGLSYIPNDPRLNESYAITLDIDNNLNYSISISGYKTTDNEVVLYPEEENNKLIHDVNSISLIHKESNWKYLKKYYLQAFEISSQNKKVRTKFQNYEYKTIFEKIKLFKNANFQDIKNRLAGIIISFFRLY